jgi:hypothetical protein
MNPKLPNPTEATPHALAKGSAPLSLEGEAVGRSYCLLPVHAGWLYGRNCVEKEFGFMVLQLTNSE